LQARQVVLEGGRAQPLGVQFRVATLQAPIGFCQTVLQDAFEASFGVALLAVVLIFALEASLAAAEGVLEDEASEGEGGGEDGATAEGMPEEIRVHARVSPPAQDAEHLCSIEQMC
jgi:hypothetical protein